MPIPEFKPFIEEVKKSVKEIQPQQLREMIDHGENISIVDVREPEEWQKGTIPGAATIARGWIEMRIDQVTTDLNAKVVLYCAAGNRSTMAAESLQRMGFRNVSSLAGGYNGWVATEEKK